MDKNQSPVVVINTTELDLNQSPISNYGIDKGYREKEVYRVRCVNCKKSETGPPRFKTCSRCISIGVKKWEPLYHFYCSRECQAAHWPKHRIEHQLYEAKKHATPKYPGGDTHRQQTIKQVVARGTQCNVKDDSKNSGGKILYPSTERYFSSVSYPFPPSQNICYYHGNPVTKKTDATTDMSDAPKRNKKRATDDSLLPKKEDYSSLSSENIKVVNVNEYPPLPENYVYHSDESSSGSDAGGSNMYIFMDGDGKKSAILKKRKKKDKKTFNPRVLFERDQQKKLTSTGPTIKEISADEVNSLAAKCKVQANRKDTSITNATHTGKAQQVKQDVPKDKNIDTNVTRVSSTESKPCDISPAVRSTEEIIRGKQNPQLLNPTNSKKPAKEKKPYTDADFMVITKSSTKTLYTGSSATRKDVMSRLPQSNLNEKKTPLTNPKSMELLKRKMDDFVCKKFRSQSYSHADKIENLMLNVLDQYLGLEDSSKPQGKVVATSKHQKLSGVEDDTVQKSMSQKSSDVLQDLDKAKHPETSKTKAKDQTEVGKDKTKDLESSKFNVEHPEVSKRKPKDIEANKTKTEDPESSKSKAKDSESSKAKDPETNNSKPKDAESNKSKTKDADVAENVKSQKSKKNGKKHQELLENAPEDDKSQNLATKLLSKDRRKYSDDLKYSIPPLIHTNYPRPVDQYNGADPNDPFIEYSSSQSFVVQKPHTEYKISYIGLLLSEKPNTVITQRYILLKNAAYDGRDIELGIEREIHDVNEAGDPLYFDYIIRKIAMKKHTESKSAGSMLTAGNPSNILSKLRPPSNLTSTISSSTRLHSSFSVPSLDELNSKSASSVLRHTNQSTATNMMTERVSSPLNASRKAEKVKTATNLPVVEDSFISKNDSTDSELEGLGRFQVRNSSQEFGDIFSEDAEQQMANAPTLDLSRVFDDQFDIMEAKNDNALPVHKTVGIHSTFDAFCISNTVTLDDPFLLRTAKRDSFAYQFRKTQGCIFIIKRWQDYYY